MEFWLEKYKGIHPGLILDRELKKRNLKKGQFALSLPDHPQTINAITKGNRSLTPEISLKIDRALGFEDGTMYILQAHYLIKIEKQKEQFKLHPDLARFRKILFWDTDIDKIDWEKQYKAVIQRIFERGNRQEKKDILAFYGEEKVKEVMGRSTINNNSIAVLSHNKLK